MSDDLTALTRLFPDDTEWAHVRDGRWISTPPTPLDAQRYTEIRDGRSASAIVANELGEQAADAAWEHIASEHRAQGQTRTIEELVAELGETEERIVRIVYYLRRQVGDEAVIASRWQADPTRILLPDRDNPIVVRLTPAAVEAVRRTVAEQIPATMATMD